MFGQLLLPLFLVALGCFLFKDITSSANNTVTSSIFLPTFLLLLLPLPVTHPHLRANLISPLLSPNLTSVFSFYFERRINPTALPHPPPPLLLFTTSIHHSPPPLLSGGDDLAAVSHLHADSSSVFLLLSAAPVYPVSLSLT